MPTAPAFTHPIHRAVTPADLAGAREVVLHTAETDLGYGYRSEWHWDLDRLVETYVDNPRQAMFVATDEAGTVVATAAIRVGGPNVPPHPVELGRRYADRQTVAQLLRVATMPAHRRFGLARRLVAACHRFVRDDGGYRVIYLHTNTRVPAAEPFWRSLPVVEIADDRGAGARPALRHSAFRAAFGCALGVTGPPSGYRLRSRFTALSPAARLLVANQFGVNVGFYMVLPYLATYLAEDLGYAAALVGAVLGARVLAQQGMFLVGGTAADRLGCRPMIIVGCALRVVAFGLFALTSAPAGVLVAVVLTGLAGALFNPAVRTYLTREAGPDDGPARSRCSTPRPTPVRSPAR